MRRKLTIRNLPEGMARRLEQVRKRHGGSLDRTILDLLAQELDTTRPDVHDNGLGLLAGTWTDADVAEFQRATAAFETVDTGKW